MDSPENDQNKPVGSSGFSDRFVVISNCQTRSPRQSSSQTSSQTRSQSHCQIRSQTSSQTRSQNRYVIRPVS